jgi:hypothetical protein
MGAHEPESQSSTVDRWMDQAVDVVERVLVAAVALVLIVLSFAALWDTVVLMRDQLQVHDLTRAITVGVDTVFLTVILLELLHTVIGREPLARQAPDFIVIGITSAIRHGLSLVATASASGESIKRVIGGKTYLLTVPGSGNPREIVIDLAINSAGVLVLVVGLWIVRNSFRDLEAHEDV